VTGPHAVARDVVRHGERLERSKGAKRWVRALRRDYRRLGAISVRTRAER
jgi:hypothetical protein